LALNRNFGETHGALAALAALSGDDDAARDGIRRALRLNSQTMSVQYAQFVLSHRTGDRESARALLETFLDRPVPGKGFTFRTRLQQDANRSFAGTYSRVLN